VGRYVLSNTYILRLLEVGIGVHKLSSAYCRGAQIFQKIVTPQNFGLQKRNMMQVAG